MPITGRKETLVVTAIPRGFDGLSPRVGVHISPRLSYSGTPTAVLADFPDFDFWPPGSWTWQASFDGGVTYLTPTSVLWNFDTELWKSTFHSELPVKSFTGDPGPARTVTGYSYNGLAKGIKEMLQAPTIGASPFGQLMIGQDVSEAIPPREPDGDDAADALHNYVAFMRPSSATNLTATPQPGHLDPDFHERLTLLMDHPRLMEKLGLVLELRFAALPALVTVSTVRVRAQHTFSPVVPGTIVSLPTQVLYNRGTGIFAAATASTVMDTQLRLKLDTPAFTVHSVDVDGVAAVALAASRNERVEEPTVVPPAARSVGLTLARAGRAQAMQTTLTTGRAKALSLVATPGAPPAVNADLMIIGHHVQVLDETHPRPAWRGLAWRAVTYSARKRGEVPGNESFVGISEAPISAGARLVDGNPAQLAVSDVIAKWDGWSLGVKMPGRHALQRGPVDTVFDPEPDAPANTWLKMSSMVPEFDPDGGDARLPALRFGHSYRFRARAVDITGFGHRWDGAATTAPVVFQRFEPIPVPVVLPTPSLTRTEAPLRLVVRSNPRSLELPTVRSVRTVVPDRSSVAMHLQTGSFDVAGVPDASRYADIAALDETLLPLSGTPVDASGQPTALTVDWLPDPMSTGVVVDFPEGDEREASFLPPGAVGEMGADVLGSWQSVALVLEGGVVGSAPLLKPTESRPGQRVVAMRLAPGSTRSLELRSQFPGTRIMDLGLVVWAEEAGKSGRLMAVRGEMPGVTPKTTVDLVHAVRQPLLDPQITATSLNRHAGEKDAPITVDVNYPASSSSRISVVASWSDWQDIGAYPRDHSKYAVPTLLAVPRSVVVEEAVKPDASPGVAGLHMVGRVTFPDLRRRDLTVRAIASSCFVEEFRKTLTTATFGTLPGGGATIYLKLPVTVDVESVRISRDGRDLVRGQEFELVFTPLGTPRLTYALMAGVDPTGITVTGVEGTVLATSPAVTLIVPSAVRPEPPRPLYALPAFKVINGGLNESGKAVAGRTMNRLRIWLERPWWSSGSGEKLAVITTISGQTLPLDDEGGISRLVTQLGSDPILLRPLSVSRLHGAMTGTPILLTALHEDVGAVSSVTAYVQDVTYDPDRDLYWAEVGLKQVPQGSFIRLAIARYQEHTAPGVPKISKIVTMDPIALLPERGVTVSKSFSNLKAVFTGTSHIGTSTATKPYMRMSLQRRTQAGSTDDLGWDTQKTVTGLVNASTRAYPQLTLTAPTTAGTYRLLFEECEKHLTADEAGVLSSKEYLAGPNSASKAFNDLVGERVVWAATTPLPTG